MSFDSPYLTLGSSVVSLDSADLDAAWNDVSLATGELLTRWGANQLRAGLDGDVKTVFIEDQYVCKDYRNLHSNFYTKKFVDRPSRCSRLHFFSEPNLSKEQLVFDSAAHQEHYLGYSVIEPLATRCIGRTVVDPRKLSSVNCDDFFCLRTPFRSRVHGADYTVCGYPYRSQSAEATVCAHTVLWSVCRYLSQRYNTYGELLPYDLIERTGASHGRRFPNRSMTYTDYSEILHSFGCHPQLIRPRNFDGTGKRSSWTSDRESFYDLYAYMESGFPILTSFGGHVVSLIGHTLQKTPRADHDLTSPFVNSAAYLDSYVVVDDNFFPYQLLRYSGESQYHNNCYPSMLNQPTIDNINTAVVPLPEKIFLSARGCRSKTLRLLEQPDIQRMIRETRAASNDTNGPVVARQFVTAGAPFKARKREAFLRASTDQLTRFPLTVNLPHFVWVIELLTEGLAGQRRAFGEVVMDATQGEADWEPIYVRIGDNLIAGNRQLNNTGVELSFDQFIHNLGGSL